jgi:L-aminopeptidase/D-esterase-like protein
LALAVSPAHTLLDGDVAFALSTGRGPVPRDLSARLRLETAVVDVVRTAIERSVTVR